MQGLTININWEYFLGIMATLICVAWYSGGRFSKLETSVDFIRAELARVWASMDANNKGLVQTNSPTTLTPKGIAALSASGLTSYIDAHKEEMKKNCFGPVKTPTAYDIQTTALKCVSEWNFDEETEKQLKQQSFNDGLTVESLKFAGGIYLRDLIFKELNYALEDIDRTNPSINNEI